MSVDLHNQTCTALKLIILQRSEWNDVKKKPVINIWNETSSFECKKKLKTLCFFLSDSHNVKINVIFGIVNEHPALFFILCS